MSFAIDTSLTHIAVPESCVVEMYRSTAAVRLNDARFRGNPCEAYICLTNVEQVVKAYVALLESGMNSIWVYTSELTTDAGADNPAVLAEASAFVGELGFTMERINLDFSPAMREVIIKGLRVMRPPKKAPVLRHARQLAKVALPAEPHHATAAAEAVGDPARQQELQAEVAILQEELAVTRTQLENLREENSAMAASSTVGQAALQERLAGLESDNNNLRQQLQTAQDLNLAKNEELQKENDQLAGRLAVAESANSAAADKIAALTMFETSWKDGQLREEELCRNIDMLQEQNSRLSRELEQMTVAAGREESLLARIAELEQAEAAAREEIDRLHRTGIEAAAAEIKALAAAKMDIETEYIRLANERREQEEEMLEALYSAEQEILRLETELASRRRAGRTVEPTATPPPAEAPAGKPDKGLMVAAPAAPVIVVPAPTASPARAELFDLAESVPPPPAAPPPKPAAAAPDAVKPVEQPTTPTVTVPASAPPAAEPLPTPPPQPPPRTEAQPATPATPPVQPEPPAATAVFDDDPDQPIAGEPEITAGMVNEFGGFCGSSGDLSISFTIVPELTAIEYRHPAEVLAVIYSCNSVQAAPDGKGTQRCRGYVVALKQDGRYLIYSAWLLPEDNRVVVCTPDRQPADSKECTAILVDAVAYFEIVGFMMEFEDLGSTVGSYNRALAKTPVVRRIS